MGIHRSGNLNAWDTTLAVLWPTAGSSSKYSKLCGLRLHVCLSKYGKDRIPFDFIGDKPQGRIISFISSTVILSYHGLSAFAKVKA
jgi:hypothetical protein